MRRLSEARLSHLAHKVLDELKRGEVSLLRADRFVLVEIKSLLAEQFNKADELDALVRRKIASLSRRVEPGSREYDVLYRTYYEEERRKRR